MIPRQIVIATSIMLLVLIGLAVYAYQLKLRAERLQHHVTDGRPIAPPVSGPTEPVTLIAASDNDGNLYKVSVSAPMPVERSARARQIVRTLLDFYSNPASPHHVPERSDVNAVYIVGDNLAVVDMNAAFADTHASGILVEQLSVASIAQTLSANMPSIGRVKLLVDGHERATLAGHADIKSVYDVAALNPFVNTGAASASAK